MFLLFSSKDHFSKVIRLVRKTFHFCTFVDNYVNKQNKENHESTWNHYENAKNHLGFCNRSDIFSKVCKIKFLNENLIDIFKIGTFTWK